MEKVSLREMSLADTENIIKWKNNKNVKKNFCIQDDLTRETHEKWFHNKIEKGIVKQFIIKDIASDMEVGSVYLRDIDYNNKKAELGIFIGEDVARGKGIGTESVKLIVKYAFEELKLHRVFLRVFSNNISGIKAYEHAGFKYEGTAIDDIMLPNGEYQDISFMSIISNKMEEF